MNPSINFLSGTNIEIIFIEVKVVFLNFISISIQNSTLKKIIKEKLNKKLIRKSIEKSKFDGLNFRILFKILSFA